MSYQSKYSGQEIDELLDKVNTGGGNVTELCNINYSANKDGGIGIDYNLSDSIENYDLLYIDFLVNGKASSVVGNIIVVKDVLDKGYENVGYIVSGEWVTNGCAAFSYKFKSSTVLNFLWGSVDGDWGDYHIGKVYGIKCGSGDSTPTGNIISFMGTKAPKGYLICDGTEYNIADYPKLANHFAEQFENVAYFGGDGVNTFKVPDLRNEFLRGYGELSEDIGLHQDATQHTGIYVSNYGRTIYCPNYDYANIGNTNKATNTDSEITNADLGTDASKYQIAGQDGGYTSIVGSQYATSVAKYTSRPTNVAVLYCIKY